MTTLTEKLIADLLKQNRKNLETIESLKLEIIGEESVLIQPIIRDEVFPNVSTPLPSTPLDSDTIIFDWSANGIDSDFWRVFAYTGTGKTGTQLFDSGELPSGDTDATVSALPIAGEKVYISLDYTNDGAFKTIEYEYDGWTRPADATPPRIVTPAANSTLEQAQNFLFSLETTTDIVELWLILGTGVGLADVYNSGGFPPTDLNETINITLTSDSTIHARFSYRIGATWTDIDYVYNYVAPVVNNSAEAARMADIHFLIGVKSTEDGLIPSGPIAKNGLSGSSLDVKGRLFKNPQTGNVSMVKYQECSNFTIQNNAMEGTGSLKLAKSSGHCGIFLNKCHNFTIRLNDIWDFFNAIRLNQCYNYTIELNTCHDSMMSAIQTSRGVSQGEDCIIQNNHTFNTYMHTMSGDMISVFQCVGNSSGKFITRNNFAHMWKYGAPEGIDFYNPGQNGGLIMGGDGGDYKTGVPQQYIELLGNACIDGGHYGCAIVGGRNNKMNNNMVWIDKLTPFKGRGNGITCYDQPSKINTNFGNHEVVGNRAYARGRNAGSDNCGEVVNNYFLNEGVAIESDNLGPEAFTRQDVIDLGVANTIGCRTFDHAFKSTPRLNQKEYDNSEPPILINCDFRSY